MRYGADNNSRQLDIVGALGEAAFAKYLGVPYDPAVGPLDYDGDVGHWQVRTTVYSSGHLLLHPSDSDDSWFVLMTGRDGWYMVCGAILARDGKRPEYWRDLSGAGRFCYCVPQSALKPIAEVVHGR